MVFKKKKMYTGVNYVVFNFFFLESLTKRFTRHLIETSVYRYWDPTDNKTKFFFSCGYKQVQAQIKTKVINMNLQLLVCLLVLGNRTSYMHKCISQAGTDRDNNYLSKMNTDSYLS